MKRTMEMVVLGVALLGATTAIAQTKDAKTAAPAPAGDAASMFPKPGAETKALAPLVGTMKMAGTMKAGAMGPGSPEMATKGTHTCKWTKDQLWLDCDITSSTSDKKMAAWVGHIHSGYDFQAKTYRSVMVDNMGVAALMEGKLEGQKLVLESVGNYMMMGKPIKTRITIDMTDAKAIKYQGEMQMDGKWMVTDEATMTKGGK